jgi:tRNA (mo5U34)-methyltransferase
MTGILSSKWFHNVTLPDGFQTNPSQNWDKKLADLLQLLPTNIYDKTILDIGCNGGYFETKLPITDAIDFNDLYVAQCKFVCEQYKLSTRVLCHDIEKTPFNGKWDIVLLMGVIYHVKNPFQVIENALSSTKELLVIETAINKSKDPIWEYKYKNRHHMLIPSISCLEQVIKNCNGVIKEIVEKTRLWVTVCPKV